MKGLMVRVGADQSEWGGWWNGPVAWGGLSVKDGYLQRSARLPKFKDAGRFYRWLLAQGIPLIQRNN
jgi:hypothetical protein